MGKNNSSINLMSQGSRQEIKTQAIILATFVAIFWLLEILDQFVFRGSLDIFGIIPHQVIGLRGILFAPFLHGDFPHLIANTVPFLILGWLVMLQETSDFFIVTGLTMLVGPLLGLPSITYLSPRKPAKTRLNLPLQRLLVLALVPVDNGDIVVRRRHA